MRRTRTAHERLIVVVVALLVYAAQLMTNPRYPGSTTSGIDVYDALAGSGSCAVTSDGITWYGVASARFSPLEVLDWRCTDARLRVAPAAVPRWAKPAGRTKALFTAVSLVEIPRERPLLPLASLAHKAHVPVTWLLGGPWVPSNDRLLDGFHSMGDGVEVYPPNNRRAHAAWRWFDPTVAVLGGGWERSIDLATKAGDRAFWGIAWNSLGTDLTSDRGAPWGLYCADVASYKRPSRTERCNFAGVEWSARDLTMAYETGREDAYSTVPDDLRLRSGLTPDGAAIYERQLVDAYAAAGESAPLVMVIEEEAWEFARAAGRDSPILLAAFDQAKRDGMTVTTLGDAVRRLTPEANRPRATAFPALASSGRYGPATIDAHDEHVGLTFRAAHTLPSRVFVYDAATTSVFNKPVPELAPGDMPTLISARARDGVMEMRFRAPVATYFGAAFWTDPQRAGWESQNVVSAGRAGAVAFFHLDAGETVVKLRCRTCTSKPFAYAGG